MGETASEISNLVYLVKIRYVKVCVYLIVKTQTVIK